MSYKVTISENGDYIIGKLYGPTRPGNCSAIDKRVCQNH
jgi:hypothetical protein